MTLPEPPALNALLAFDTATEHMSLALRVGERCWAHEAPGGALASSTLVPALLALLGEAGLTPRGLDAIAFGRGPGAFTGLRTACAVAQGLAFGAAVPVLPIDTLLAIAEDARDGAAAFRVWALLDARMDEIYAAQYAHADRRWTVLDVPALTTPGALMQRWQAQPPQAVAGNAPEAFGTRLDCGDAERFPTARPRATAMLTLAQAAWAQGGAVDAAHALPLYLRDKVALTTAERQAVKSS